MDQILGELHSWSLQKLALSADQAAEDLDVVSGDASFRRYYRLMLKAGGSVIVVHAPPEKEDNLAFSTVQDLLHRHGARVPKLLAWDEDRGFLLQEDFGDQLLHPLLVNSAAADHYYRQAFRILLAMQAIPASAHALPHYDNTRLNDEMTLFITWFVEGLLSYSLNSEEREMLANVFELLSQRAEQQAQVVVHRDFHSRNIMVLADEQLGVIDFQDAVVGPITYDLVSLVRDCYISWSPEQVEEWIGVYRLMAQRAGLLGDKSESEFLQDADWMGLQRHIKVLGIFARLHLRDNKSGYLPDLPLVISYTLSVASQYPEFDGFCDWFAEKLMPIIVEQFWYQELEH
ncbi:N-acetylmuramate/N-acetylglucosamine kinase [Zhongshania aliphaticivorans]|uniref:N-acetylmuramate/N-acetylglucosamine kinase n=1 Tax=Zhongshania aliphaticivorans TaxID=1470434 RepID=A0A5S9Q5C4_9GAMM|nr:phosphotransferase [Zhongshania aliphaticivorans]CAA0095127.1 N-acetylmuramate/N-acetylglucosamine kinase [Zhongshania aliphaticivorans]CAA0112909.1 N-acetylmuramate/N-acetylglucosamine kinase [Zhongshania aliphaticivorans]